MKKIFVLLSAALISFSVFANTAESSVDSDSEQAVSSYSEKSENVFVFNIHNARFGTSFDAGVCFGTLSNYIWQNMGLGLAGEYDLPVYLIGNSRPCISTRITGSFNPPHTELINYMWNIRSIVALSIRFPLGSSGWVLQPEIAYGLCFNFPHATEGYGNELKTLYVDQMLQIAFSVRWSSPDFLHEKFELEACPCASISPEIENAAHYVGFRLGILYKFDVLF